MKYAMRLAAAVVWSTMTIAAQTATPLPPSLPVSALHISGQPTYDVVRTVVHVDMDHRSGIGYGNNSGLNVSLTSSSGQRIPPYTGLRLVGVDVASSFSGEVTATLRNASIAPEFGRVRVTWNWHSVDPNDRWGITWGAPDFLNLQTAAPIAPGDVGVVQAATFGGGARSYASVQMGWLDVYSSCVGPGAISYSAGCALSQPIPAGVPDLVDVTFDVDATHTLALHVGLEPTVNVTSYCAATPNSSGAAARLEAFGAPVAGDDWLRVRARGVPTGTPIVLLGASQPASIPAGGFTYCIGGTRRYTSPVQITSTNLGAPTDFDMDLIGLAPGSVLFVQAVFREGANGTNVSDALVIPLL